MEEPIEKVKGLNVQYPIMNVQCPRVESLARCKRYRCVVLLYHWIMSCDFLGPGMNPAQFMLDVLVQAIRAV